MDSKPRREINILLLGETGAGKSTTLNVFVNYLKYPTFEGALNSLENFSELVSCQFNLYDPETRQPWIVKSGPDDDNERHGQDGTVTQAPKEYKLEFGEFTLRLIDTPGIGDIGENEEGNTFDRIFQLLQNYQQLNAILIVMKGNSARKTTIFKYCISQLLNHLHKSVCQNIIFCFTFSRNSNYGPGEGYVTLKAVLDDDLQVDTLKLAPKVNCFFIDNEAFRFMLAKKKNFPFSKKQENRFCESWEESAQQIESMFGRITINLTPHELNKTISLNMDRKIISDLAQPIIQLSRTVMENIEAIERQQCELEEKIKTKEVLNHSLYIEVKECQVEQLRVPQTACINKSCSKLIKSDFKHRIDHSVCHSNCTCLFVEERSFDQIFLKFCKVIKLEKFGLGSAKCRVCGCSWRNHIHLSTSYKSVTKRILNNEVQKEIFTTEESIEKYRSLIKETQQLSQEFKQEESAIMRILSKFEYILNENSVFSQNQYFEQYFEYFIQAEERKGKTKNVQQLEEMKLAHRNSVQVLREEVKKDADNGVKIEEIPELIEQLRQLKHSGANFQQIFNTEKEPKLPEFHNSSESDEMMQSTYL